MTEHKIIIPSCDVVLVIDGEIQNRVLEEGETLIDISNYNDVVSLYYGTPIWNETLELFEPTGELKPIEKPHLSEAQKLWDMVDYLIASEYGM